MWAGGGEERDKKIEGVDIHPERDTCKQRELTLGWDGGREEMLRGEIGIVRETVTNRERQA